MPRILIADDHPTVRHYVRQVLEAEKGWAVCGEASTGREAVAMTAVERPDVVVLDLSMPELNGLEAAREIHEKFPQTEMLILTMHDMPELFREALASGVRAYVLKSDLHLLVAAVRSVLQSGGHSSNPKSNDVVEEKLHGNKETANHPGATLTDLEQQIVRMLAQAKGNKEIALALGLTENSVETHRAAIMRKLEINSIFDLVRYAVGEHLVEVKSI
jgi:DNA-binding NarL/FixJ family response regulator